MIFRQSGTHINPIRVSSLLPAELCGCWPPLDEEFEGAGELFDAVI